MSNKANDAFIEAMTEADEEKAVKAMRRFGDAIKKVYEEHMYLNEEKNWWRQMNEDDDYGRRS